MFFLRGEGRQLLFRSLALSDGVKEEGVCFYFMAWGGQNLGRASGHTSYAQLTTEGEMGFPNEAAKIKNNKNTKSDMFLLHFLHRLAACCLKEMLGKPKSLDTGPKTHSTCHIKF